ncbi:MULTISPECIES: hypothetical protein [unclassified Nostoc]|nr:hypothetical protein [Nostoc sp. JL23]
MKRFLYRCILLLSDADERQRRQKNSNAVLEALDLRYSGHSTPLDLCHATIDE